MMKYQIPIHEKIGATCLYKIIHIESGCEMTFNRSNLTYYGQCLLNGEHACFNCSVNEINDKEFTWDIKKEGNGICFY
jgi:hypothetical protein